MEVERRHSERVGVFGEIGGDVMVCEPMAVREIGLDGAQIETRFPLLVDSLHDFRLALGDRSVVVKGRVAHEHVSDVDPDAVTYRAGIEFIDPPGRVLAVIAEFIEQIRAGRK